MMFLADMGVSQKTVRWLRAALGSDVVHVREEGMQQASDADIIDKARREGRIVLTFDLDFADIMAASGEPLPSIVLFRLENCTPENVNRRLATLLKQSSDALKSGAIVIVEDARYRVRFLPV